MGQLQTEGCCREFALSVGCAIDAGVPHQRTLQYTYVSPDPTTIFPISAPRSTPASYSMQQLRLPPPLQLRAPLLREGGGEGSEGVREGGGSARGGGPHFDP